MEFIFIIVYRNHVFYMTTFDFQCRSDSLSHLSGIILLFYRYRLIFERERVSSLSTVCVPEIDKRFVYSVMTICTV
jgi:hypothetical protein